MPRRELSYPNQITGWFQDWGQKLQQPAEMVLIGSAGLPENSMDADPVTDSDELAWLCYDALIGSEFEQEHGWHVNLMPSSVLNEMPQDWKARTSKSQYHNLTVVVPHPADLLAPKLRRNEPRDRLHAAWAQEEGLL